MIDGFSPDIAAITKNCVVNDNKKAEPQNFNNLLFMLLVNNNVNSNLLSEILPYTGFCDKGWIVNALNEIKRGTSSPRPAKRGSLNKAGRAENLLCILKKYADDNARYELCRMEKILSDIKVFTALARNPSPQELMRYAGMGDIANIMNIMPQMMSFLNKNE